MRIVVGLVILTVVHSSSITLAQSLSWKRYGIPETGTSVDIPSSIFTALRQDALQKLTRVARAASRHFLGCPLGHDFSTLVARVRSKVNDPIGGFDHVEIVFNHNDRMPRLHESLKNLEQHTHIVKVQAGGGFIE